MGDDVSPQLLRLRWTPACGAEARCGRLQQQRGDRTARRACSADTRQCCEPASSRRMYPFRILRPGPQLLLLQLLLRSSSISKTACTSIAAILRRSSRCCRTPRFRLKAKTKQSRSEAHVACMPHVQRSTTHILNFEYRNVSKVIKLAFQKI